MYLSKISDALAEDGASLVEVQATISTLASGLDSRFVQAGTALATVFDIIERLVSSLEGVTSAMDRKAADAAVENMRATADRLTRLPALQAERQKDLAAVRQASRTLRGHITQINKTLSFLRICGLNIKIAAAGAEEFNGFADNMLTRLELGETQLAGFEQELRELSDRIAGMADAEKLLAAECAKVIPQVPKKLAEDAIALQQHQLDLAHIAARIADVAREIRNKVATALGALQIGDITRQRLEHVADGILLLGRFSAEQGITDPVICRTVESHVLGLLAAQAADTIGDFQREARLLTQSLRGIAPDAGRLLALRDEGAGGRDGRGGGQSFLHVLEKGIAEVENVTGQLRAADEYSDRLGSATSETAESLERRLRAVRNVQVDVEQMAWNTGLRCRRMGQDGRALEVIATEIRAFANNLESVSDRIHETFKELASAAGSMRDQREQGGGTDAGRALTDSLSSIRAGGRRMEESLSSLDGDAATVATILRDTTSAVDCEAEIGEALAQAAGRLAALAPALGEIPEPALEPLRDIMGRIHRSYTMARERDVHRQFALPGDEVAEAATGDTGSGEQSDDDLFDDALF
ncbi:hypothetical protein [Sphingomonas quercus]|uniref:Methyl-accepting chemotaxis protein n=1 Tax=Sphingomonas quercus TaxID=2842451 RepID=A0ABS6BIB9_9SPHN|nr:hypothetical protein [Sphingomonas quercus]MBU3078058.1 hypothetical protein [Sphingomonas quercus]